MLGCEEAIADGSTIIPGFVIRSFKGGDMVDHAMPFGERRLHGRKSCSRTVGVVALKSSYKAHLRDLAPGGAMIEPPLEIKSRIGEELIMTIPYGLKKDELTVKGKITWIRPNGIGVQFVTKDSV
jgi:hypothetical protein